MKMLTLEDQGLKYQWASDVNFDGLRLEILSGNDVLFDISLPDNGPLTINTFGRSVDIAFFEAAIQIARCPR